MYLAAAALLWSPAPVVAGWCSPDWRARDAASALAVRRYGPADWRWADALAAPECRWRAERARAAVESAALRRLGPLPAADAAWFCRKAPLNPWVVSGLRAELDRTGRDAYPHALYRLATRNWVAARLRAGVPESALGPLLEDMRRQDAAYYRGLYWPVPWEN